MSVELAYQHHALPEIIFKSRRINSFGIDPDSTFIHVIVHYSKKTTLCLRLRSVIAQLTSTNSSKYKTKNIII